MLLKEVILNCDQYPDEDDQIHIVFAVKANGKFDSNSDALVLNLSEQESEANIQEIANSKCPGYDYFLEIFLIQELMEDLEHLEEYGTNDKKVHRVIHYAEYDA